MPAKYQLGDEQRKGSIMINGLRPSPLMINSQSKPIKQQHQHQQRRRQEGPVIIYTESPKIIHTKPHEFMALVQRLTGLRESIAEQGKIISVGEDEDEDDEEEEGYDSGNPLAETENGPNEFLADFPLFTPTSNNLFLSPPPAAAAAAQVPHPLHRYGDFLSLSPSVAKMESSSSTSSSSLFSVKREFINIMK